MVLSIFCPPAIFSRATLFDYAYTDLNSGHMPRLITWQGFASNKFCKYFWILSSKEKFHVMIYTGRTIVGLKSDLKHHCKFIANSIDTIVVCDRWKQKIVVLEQ